jgi:hypothetical protein
MIKKFENAFPKYKMAGDLLRTKSILAQFANATKDDNENVKFALDESNVNIWYVMLHNLKGGHDEFIGGEYLFRIHIPEGAGKTWVREGNPPRFIPLTPNGVYKTNAVSCIGIGEFHKGSKVASMGVGDFVTQLVSGMIVYEDLKGGVNLVYTETNPKGKQKIAEQSKDYNNKHYPEIVNLVNNAYFEYSQKFSKVSQTERIKELMDDVKPVVNPSGQYDNKINKTLEPSASS